MPTELNRKTKGFYQRHKQPERMLKFFIFLFCTLFAQSAYAIMCSDGTYIKNDTCVAPDVGYYASDCSLYTELVYIKSTGTQWINTGYIPTANTSMKFKIYMDAHSPSVIIGTNANGNDDADWRLFNAEGKIFWDYNTSRLTGGTLTTKTTYEMEVGNNYVKQNGVQVLSGPKQTTGTSYPIGIFSSIDWSTARGNIYYLKIYENGILVRDFIPAIRNADWVAGMYEKIQGKFYTNEGSGTFSTGGTEHSFLTDCTSQTKCPAGYYCIDGVRIACPSNTYSDAGATQCKYPDSGHYVSNCAGELSSGYTETDYFVSTGTQWINTQYIPTENTYIKFGLNMSENAPSVIIGNNARDNDDADWRLFNAEGKIFWDYNTSRLTGGTLTAGTYYDMEVGNNYVKQNGNVILSGTKQTTGINFPIGIFSSTATSVTARGRIYYLQIYENEVLVRDFIPATRNSDGAAGMYERIQNAFYMSDGTGGHAACASQTLCEAGYYCTNGNRNICTNAPNNAIYVQSGISDNSCPWECASGYGKTILDACEKLCDAGIRYLKSSSGVNIPLFPIKHTSPTMAVGKGGAVCYADLIEGQMGGTINIQYNDKIYHTLK